MSTTPILKEAVRLLHMLESAGTRRPDVAAFLDRYEAWMAAPAERKPVVGWVTSKAHPFDWYIIIEAGRRTKINVSAFGGSADDRFFRIECEDSATDDGVTIIPDQYGYDSDEALLFAAEDALFAIADAINALRGRK